MVWVWTVTERFKPTLFPSSTSSCNLWKIALVHNIIDQHRKFDLLSFAMSCSPTIKRWGRVYGGEGVLPTRGIGQICSKSTKSNGCWVTGVKQSWYGRQVLDLDDVPLCRNEFLLLQHTQIGTVDWDQGPIKLGRYSSHKRLGSEFSRICFPAAQMLHAQVQKETWSSCTQPMTV